MVGQAVASAREISLPARKGPSALARSSKVASWFCDAVHKPRTERGDTFEAGARPEITENWRGGEGGLQRAEEAGRTAYLYSN